MKRKIFEAEPIQLILKISGDACNINCKYCYEKQRKYNSSEFLLAKTLEEVLANFKGKNIFIQLHGGEPLLVGKQRMSEILSVIKEHDGRHYINLQTNATLLTEDWLDFFDEICPELEIGISIDGNYDCNAFRVDYDNNCTFYEVDKALRLCNNRNKNIGIISVVNKNCLSREEKIIDYFAQYHCIKMINFMPCINFENEKLKSELENWATTPLEYSAFIKKFFSIWNRKKLYRQFLFDPALSIIRRLYGKTSTLCHYSDVKCSNIFTLFPDGSLGYCDEINLNTNLLSYTRSEEELLFENKLRQALALCNKCSYFDICTGGCLGTRLRYESSEYRRKYCISRADLIDYIAIEIGMSPINGHLPENYSEKL